MNSLLILVPVSLVLLGVAIGAFWWAVRRGQFDDLDTPPLDILRDTEHPAPRPMPMPMPMPMPKKGDANGDRKDAA